MLKTDIGRMCAALNAGDDDALFPLADAMEEAGDPRAAGCAAVLRDRPPGGPDYRPDMPDGHRWGWWWDGGEAANFSRPPSRAVVPSPTFLRLRQRCPLVCADWVGYSSRSAAWLALATAFAPAEENP
jgi:hypothetical protein